MHLVHRVAEDLPIGSRRVTVDGLCQGVNEPVLDRLHAAGPIRGDHGPPGARLVPVLQHLHHALVANEVGIAKAAGSPGGSGPLPRQTPSQRNGGDHPGVNAAAGPDVESSGRIADQTAVGAPLGGVGFQQRSNKTVLVRHAQTKPVAGSNPAGVNSEETQFLLQSWPQVGIRNCAEADPTWRVGAAIPGEALESMEKPARFGSGQPDVEVALTVQWIQQQSPLRCAQHRRGRVGEAGANGQAEAALFNAAPEWQAGNLRWRSQALLVACPLEGLVRNVAPNAETTHSLIAVTDASSLIKE